jgi:hypothetical protein
MLDIYTVGGVLSGTKLFPILFFLKKKKWHCSYAKQEILKPLFASFLSLKEKGAGIAYYYIMPERKC